MPCSALKQVVKVTAPLARIVGKEELPRTEITKAL
jgi:chromatin remodeling complex protein RSC6